MDVDPSKIDVNIHPTKHEVKFEDGRHVYTLLQSVVKKNLGQYFILPSETQLSNVTSNQEFRSNQFPTTQPNARFNPFDSPKARIPTNWEKLDELLNAPIETNRQQEFTHQEVPNTAIAIDPTRHS